VVPIAIPSRILFPPTWRVFVVALIFIVATSIVMRREPWALGLLAVSTCVLAGVFVAGLQSRHGALLYGDSLPIRVGEPFRGHIDIELDPVPARGFWLVLRCFEIGSRTNAQITRWQNEVMVDARDVVPMTGRIRIPFTIDMPSELDIRGTHWQLEITAERCAARFPLEAVASDGVPTVPDELLRPFESVRESLRDLGHS
jgi:hypothetical protein